MGGHGIPRRSGRIIVLDERERVLLIGVRDPERAGLHRQWITPGGRTQDRETTRAAAARELAEETGHVVTDVELGTQVAYFESVWDAPDGVRYQVRDDFWFVRTHSFAPDPSGMEAHEREELVEHRWWALPSLLDVPSSEVVLPIGLGTLTADLLEHGRPEHPVRLPA